MGRVEGGDRFERWLCLVFFFFCFFLRIGIALTFFFDTSNAR